MWQAVGQLVPIAVALAISSVPIMVMIMILLSPNRNASALPFLLGWVIGIALVVFLSTLGANALPEAPRRVQDTLAAVLEIVIGAVLICGAAISFLWRSRLETAGVPSWLQSVESFGPLSSFAVAVALNFRPKGLVLGVAAGLVFRGASLPPGEAAVGIAIYTVLAASTVVVPIIATLLAPNRAEPRLVAAQAWLTKNGGIVAALMLFMIGVVILADGLAGL
jgi:hypothetical protein